MRLGSMSKGGTEDDEAEDPTLNRFGGVAWRERTA